MPNRSNYQDPLSVILSAIQLRVSISVNAQFCGGWLLGHKTGAKSFHLVAHGRCQLCLEGDTPQDLNAGDLIIFMREVKHKLKPIEGNEHKMERLDYEQGVRTDSTGILCGSFTYENTTSENILSSLPPILVVKKSLESASWVDPLVQLIQLETRDSGLGSDLIINQLAASLIIYAIRSYITAGDFKIGILKLIADKRLNKALQAMQNEPETAWTLAQLAKESAMSRTSFATQFKQVSGWTPKEYLTWWRMQKAWLLLTDGYSILHVAEKVGYRSESAFARAFKKTFNLGPGEIRKHHAKQRDLTILS